MPSVARPLRAGLGVRKVGRLRGIGPVEGLILSMAVSNAVVVQFLARRKATVLQQHDFAPIGCAC